MCVNIVFTYRDTTIESVSHQSYCNNVLLLAGEKELYVYQAQNPI